MDFTHYPQGRSSKPGIKPLSTIMRKKLQKLLERANRLTTETATVHEIIKLKYD